MPRKSREKSQTGIYHVMLRGIDKSQIFIDDKDNQKFIEGLVKAKKAGKFKIYAYCLMKNHVHLLIEEGDENIGDSIKRITVSYVWWHNTRYGRVGHLFQNRFRSEPINSEEYLLTVSRYIHQNPLKANMINKITDYPWSSYHNYLEYYKGNTGIVDTGMITGYFTSRKSFEDYMSEKNEDKCLEYIENKRYTDIELEYKIKDYYEVHDITEIKDSEELDNIILLIYKETGVSIRQLSRVLGIGKHIIEKAIKKTRETSPCLKYVET